MAKKKHWTEILAEASQKMQPAILQILLNQMYLERQKKGTEHYFGEMAEYQEGRVPAEQEKLRLTQGFQVCKELANKSVYPAQAYQDCVRALMSTKKGGRLGELPAVSMPPNLGPTPTVPSLKMIPSRSQEPHITEAQGILNKIAQGTLGREKYTPTAQEFITLSKAIGAQKALELMSGIQEAEFGRTGQTQKGRGLDISALQAQTASQREGRLAKGESGKTEAEKAQKKIEDATKKVSELETLLNKEGGIYDQITETQRLIQGQEETKEKHRDDVWQKEYQRLTEKLNRLKAIRDSYEKRIEVMRPWVQKGYERFEEGLEETSGKKKKPSGQKQMTYPELVEFLKQKGWTPETIQNTPEGKQLQQTLQNQGYNIATLLELFK